MPRRSLPFAGTRAFAFAALATLALMSAPRAATGQMIQIKTLPITEGDQWRFFPSANQGLGGISIALADSLLDPFENPAKGSRVSRRAHGSFFGSPTFYTVSKKAGGGRTLPMGGVGRQGDTFGGLALALQEIDAANSSQGFALPPVADVALTSSFAPVSTPAKPSRQNRFAFGSVGRVFERHGVSVGASVMWSGLKFIDGVDLLYAGSSNIAQHGRALNMRLGMLKDLSGGASFEGLVLHDRFDMAHDVTWLDFVWDPNTRTMSSRAREDHNLDRTNTWGLHLGYMKPLGDAGWRVGATMTTNLMSHPKLPDYQVAQVQVIPWDPGHSAAYDFGVGLAKVKGHTTFGIDAILEPIRTHTWGETPDSIAGGGFIVPAGGKTTENWFRFSNAIVRTGFGQDIPFDTLTGPVLRLEGGLMARSIGYHLDQRNHVLRTDRQADEGWIEWTRTWGVRMRFPDLELRYTGRTITGTGRPGFFSDGSIGVALASSAEAGRNFLNAPSGAMTLTGVAVTTHQFSVSIPLR